jgi:hypothetical protein
MHAALRCVALPAVVMAMGLAGCARVQVDPIHITVDINIRIDRALDDFFAKPPVAPVTAPGSSTTPNKP